MVQTLMLDVATNNMQIEKLVITSNKVFGGKNIHNKKVSELKEVVKVTEEAHNLAQKKYDCIKVCVLLPCAGSPRFQNYSWCTTHRSMIISLFNIRFCPMSNSIFHVQI